MKILISIALCLIVFVVAASAQSKTPDAKTEATPQTPKKTNARPAPPAKAAPAEPFDKASVEEMAKQCVALDTEAGIIQLEMFPESAPQTVRSFLNLVAAGALDTTTFSRVVPNFIIQGGDLSTSQKPTNDLARRAAKTVPDEPNPIKHERGTLSMARSDAPNSATTSFFILVASAPHLDGTFAAFGRVTSGMEFVDAINKAPVEAEKPAKPVRIKRATVAACPVQPKPSQTPAQS